MRWPHLTMHLIDYDNFFFKCGFVIAIKRIIVLTSRLKHHF